MHMDGTHRRDSQKSMVSTQSSQISQIHSKPKHCGDSKTQRKWFLDEKRDGLVDENRINNQQKEKQQKVYTPKNSFCRSNLFQTINNQLIYTVFNIERVVVFLIEMCRFYDEVVTVC